ncbi:hypothetical protein [Frankia sp. R82]|uniref:hypothetical protein n=1 Tax=Frankia sp. R82 TaxID=2950553 RepID=UPI0020443058|nr:hypothetical protein [Frankia sp. R82]MCM3886633.1 hypothetical protein [Frankia sp. R82]
MSTARENESQRLAAATIAVSLALLVSTSLLVGSSHVVHGSWNAVAQMAGIVIGAAGLFLLGILLTLVRRRASNA